MDNTNLIEITMETADTVIFRAISEIRGKSKRPDEDWIYNFVKNFLMIVACVCVCVYVYGLIILMFLG